MNDQAIHEIVDDEIFLVQVRDIDVEMIIIALNYLPLVTTYRNCSLFTLSKSLMKHLNADHGQIRHAAAVDAQRRLRRCVLHIKRN